MLSQKAVVELKSLEKLGTGSRNSTVAPSRASAAEEIVEEGVSVSEESVSTDLTETPEVEVDASSTTALNFSSRTDSSPSIEISDPIKDEAITSSIEVSDPIIDSDVEISDEDSDCAGQEYGGYGSIVTPGEVDQQHSLTDSQPPSEPKYLESVEHVLADIGEIKALETSVAHLQLGYMGTFDCLAEYKGTLCLIDWKTSSKPKPTLADCYDYPLQAVAYAGAVNQDPHMNLKVHIAVWQQKKAVTTESKFTPKCECVIFLLQD